MTSEAGASRSIRQRLVVFLVGALLLAVFSAGMINYRIAVDAANTAYDRSLLDPAIQIGRRLSVDGDSVSIDLPPSTIEALMFDGQDDLVFQVRRADGSVALGDRELPPASGMTAGETRFFDAKRGREVVRVAAFQTPEGPLVEVAETVRKRVRMIKEILFAQFVPTFAIALGSVFLAWFGISRGLRPLEHLRRELEVLRASPRNLRPLSLNDVPAEILPVKREFNRLLAALASANGAQQRFLSNAAHQLRTPLAGLTMHLDLLLQRELPRNVQADVERMRSATGRASRLATQLLALARAEQPAESALTFEALDLCDIGDSAARDWARVAIDRNVDLGFRLEPAPVNGDASLLREALDNLIDNAMRYSLPESSATVRTGMDDAGPYLIVEDSGPGIPLPERERVLERFHRVPGTAGEGSGLGLAIVHEIVGRHGGTMSIESGADQRGTLVRIRFPASDRSQGPRSDGARPSSAESVGSAATY